MSFTNYYVPNRIVMPTIYGWPSASMAILVDNTNFNSATCGHFNPYPAIDIGPSNGLHSLWFGFASLDGATTWVQAYVTLETGPPPIYITNPTNTNTLTSQPMLQLTGYSPRPLQAISFDLQNAAGAASNAPGFVIGRLINTNTAQFATNTFQCFDIPLTLGPTSITVHVTDFAGNMASTNITMTLDYSGDTNAPVITVFWPQNNEQVSGAAFTLRGSLDDPTATVSALLVDANGNASTNAALVERTGLYWVENLALAPGTNSVTITAANAAGLSTWTTLTIIDVDGALTIDNDNPSGRLVSATGTIAITGYTLWVNGVVAATNGSGSWTANSVSLGPGGTAVIQARAIPNSAYGGNGTGQDPSWDGTPSNPTAMASITAENQTDQPAMLYVQSYDGLSSEVSSSTVSCNDAGCSSSESNVHIDQTCWDLLAGGTETYSDKGVWTDECLGDGNYWSSAAYTWPNDIWPPTLDGVMIYTDSTGLDTTNAVGPPDIPIDKFALTQHATRTFTNDAFSPCSGTTTLTWDKNDQITTTMTLYTGGKGMAQAQTLLQFSASAIAYLSCDVEGLPIDGWNLQPIPPNGITLFGKPFGNDGQLYIAEPQGVEMDATPQAPGFQCVSFSFPGGSFSVTGTPLEITANTINLSQTTPTFCVGQQVNFALASTPSYAGAFVAWNLPDKYVHQQYQQQGHTGPSYLKNPFFLYNFAPPGDIGTSCWYVNGTGGTVSATVIFAFANGQTATANAQGKFIIYRPSVSMNQIQQPRFFSIAHNLTGNIVKLGSSGGATTGVMAYSLDYDTDVSGSGEITQTCQLSYMPGNANWNFVDWRCDGGENYDGPKHITPNTGTMTMGFQDGPQNGAQDVRVEVKGNFRDYIRFKPDASESIYVTLGIVTWTCDGKISLDLLDGWTWRLVTDVHPDPVGPDNSDEFPQYTHTR